ncbi:MAG TPA: DUF3618 domain-containing protein [Gemmatimonadaceae bacterium]|nr:DUF3618 domain-containing protein [Gemmatimonadaceae bacterium]
MTQETAEIVREMDATRAQMARDIDQLQARAAEKVQRVKQRLDVGQLVRDHPWPALGAAVVLGALVGGTGADTKAAVATVAGAKAGARAAADASKSAASAVKEKIHSSDDAEPESFAAVESTKPGLGERLFDSLGAMVARGLDGLVEDMRVASRDWGARMASQSRTRQPLTVATTATAVVAVAEPTTRVPRPNEAASAADEVPVPREMMPTEVDARADAVEALGGGTHEPPLAPGAGDLGARWA